MEFPNTKSAQKFGKTSSQSTVLWSSNSKAAPREETRGRTTEKLKASKLPAKENTKPQEIKLHTEQRAVKRAIFNYSVATKLYLIEQRKKQHEKLMKMIEEEEIRMLRKEMIPRAQLMPFFDRPFFPQRSNRPLTVPREPSFRVLSNKSWNCTSCSDLYNLPATSHQPMKPIK
ncbi:microtubule-destabilizing protein 60 [Malania oleifera]|uniref:microtubule-destabilizing protein 60 n=1 Tax=Malania oleifera TaxID=397392 RepID=UPI0025AE79AC|nr:microtubule-destabilizing protein 60 [Malania oleifera]